MGSLLDEAAFSYDTLDYADREEEALRLLREQQAAANPPPPPPEPALLNTGDVPYAPPVYGPPAPTYGPPGLDYGPATQAQSQASSFLGDFIGGPKLSVPAPVQDFAQDTLLPAFLNTQVGGQPIGYGAGPAQFSPPTYQQAQQVEIPYAAPVQEQFGNVGEAIGSPVGLGGVGRFVAESAVPTNLGDALLMAGLAGTAATPFEAVTGIPWGNPLNAIRGAGEMVDPAQVYRLGIDPAALTDLPPESQLLRSLGAGQVSNPAGVRILGPGDTLNPGELERYFGGRLNGPIMPGLNVTPNPDDAAVFARMADLGQNQGVLDRIRSAITPQNNFGGANLGASVAPGSNFWDESVLGPLPIRPDLGQGPAMLGGEPPAAGGRVFGEAEPMVRLYRAETTPGTGSPLPEWIQQGRAQTGMADASGRWFTDDRAKADWYLKEAGENGRLTYVDLPKSQADALRVSNNPDVQRFSLDPQSEYFLPREMADSRQPLTGGGSAPLPAENMPGGIVDRRAFEISQTWAENLPNARVADLTDTEVKTALYNAGLDSSGGPGAVRARYVEADNAGVKLPLDQPPSDMPDAIDLARRGATPQSPLNEVPPPGPVSPPPASPVTVAIQTSNATPFETAHQGLSNVVQTPTPPPSDVALLTDEVRRLRETMEASGGPPPRWGQPPPGAGGTGAGAASGGTPKGQGLIGTLRDALYAPFGFDWSSWLRQDAMRTLNPLRLFETIQVAKDSSRAIASRDTALRLAEDFKARAEALGVNMHLPDWQGKDIVNRENLYSKLLNNLPGYEALNRGFATEIASRRVNALENFAKNHPGADLQHEANRLERTTGRGSFGSGDVEKALSTVGPAFTALRYTLSIPQRTASLIPFQRLTDGSFQMFGPSWRESVIDHAGFVTTVAATMAAAQQAGFGVGWDPSNQTSTAGGKVPFGAIQLPNGTLIDLTGGSKKYVNAVMQLATGEKNGKDYPWLWEQAQNGQYKGTVAEFLRNLSGPTVQLPIAAAKEAGVKGNLLEFMRPDFWDKGVTGSGSFADRVAQFIVPLWIQDVADAVRNSAAGEHLPSQAAAGAAAFFGAGVQTYERNALADVRDALKGDPRLPEAIRGTDYKDLGPDGKAAVDKLAEQDKPDEYKNALKERDQNSDAVWLKHRETTTQINDEEARRKTELYDALRSGRIDGEQLRQGRQIAEGVAKSKRDAANNDPEFKKATSELDKSEVDKALAVYYKIPDQFKGADGKTDWDAARAKQNEFIKYVGEHDRKTANLLLYEVQTSKAPSNPLDRLYELAQPLLQKYYGDIKDDYARAQAQRANPKDDAFLALLGYGKVQTMEAGQILEQMRRTLPSPNAPVAAGAAQKTFSAPPIAAQPAPAAVPLTGNSLPPVVANDTQQRTNFVNAMAAPAQAYSQQTGIPPSVYAAMGASESNWGRAPSVFGIKGSAPSGGSANLATHEVYGGQRVNINDQFAAYQNLDEAFQHFTDLTSSGRYAPAWQHLQQTGNWEDFLHEINRAGYATAPNWADSIISLSRHIEQTYPGYRR